MIGPASGAAVAGIVPALMTMEAFTASDELVIRGNDVMIVVGSCSGLLIALDDLESCLPCWHPRVFVCGAYRFDLDRFFCLNWG